MKRIRIVEDEALLNKTLADNVDNLTLAKQETLFWYYGETAL